MAAHPQTLGLVLADRLTRPSARLVNSLGDAPINLTVIALVLTLIVVIAIKAITGTGTPLRGGLPSGHAALAFCVYYLLLFPLVAVNAYYFGPWVGLGAAVVAGGLYA